MDHSEFVVEQVERARQRRGWLENELARRAGIDCKRLWRILNNERAMRADELVRLCLVLKLPFQELVHPETVAYMKQQEDGRP